MKDLFGFNGEKDVVTGATSGMGQATTRLLVDLGAEVFAPDVKEVTAPVKKYIQTDLMSEQSIDAAVGQLPDVVDSMFSCAVLPGAPYSNVQVTMVNFVGHRHLFNSMLPRMPEA